MSERPGEKRFRAYGTGGGVWYIHDARWDEPVSFDYMDSRLAEIICDAMNERSRELLDTPRGEGE